MPFAAAANAYVATFPGGALGVAVACIGLTPTTAEIVETGWTPFCCKGGVTFPGVPIPEPMSLQAAKASEATARTSKSVRCMFLQLYIGWRAKVLSRSGY